ncbi:hypothetical protein NTGBS_370003 [Candidatus Nitrotoga sp. BS]|nr:hypothetical protein NTGBS_370003 [Candidatus Nitrotoga sp. BS]
MISEHYLDFGPAFAAEKMAERYNIHPLVESTHQIMIAAWTIGEAKKVAASSCNFALNRARPRVHSL